MSFSSSLAMASNGEQMDYQMDTDHAPHNPHQSQPGRCPYNRASTDSSNFNFNYQHPMPPIFQNPNNQYHNQQQPYSPTGQWSTGQRMNLPSYQTLTTGMGSYHHDDRGNNVSGLFAPPQQPPTRHFDTFTVPSSGELDPRAAPYQSQQTRSAEAENSQSNIQMPPSSAPQGHQRTHSHPGPNNPPTHPALPRIPDIMNTMPPSWAGRRSEPMLGGHHFPNSGSVLSGLRPRLPLPPPQAMASDPFQTVARPNFHHHAIRFESETGVVHPPAYLPSSTSNTQRPGPSFRQQQVDLMQSRPYQAALSAYRLSYAPDYPYGMYDGESASDEEDFLEEQEESIRREEEIFDHQNQSSASARSLYRLGPGPTNYDAVSRGLGPDDARFLSERHERMRAARRAAAISVKLVASANALASFESVDKETLKVDDQTCIICYNEFGVKNPDGFIEAPVRLPKCKHLFGDHCLKQWLKDSDSCPYCRDKLESEPKRNVEHRATTQPRHLGVRGETWLVAGDRASYMMNHPAVRERFEQAHPDLLLHHQNEASSDDLAMMRAHANGAWAGGAWTERPTGLSPNRHSHELATGEARRRARGRASLVLSHRSPGQPFRPNTTGGHPGPRSARNHASQISMRTPIQGVMGPDESGSSPQRRSITPYPVAPTSAIEDSIVETTSFFHTGGRPSSLPSERSPLQEASSRPEVMEHRSMSGNGTSHLTLPSPLTDAGRRNGTWTPQMDSFNSRNDAPEQPGFRPAALNDAFTPYSAVTREQEFDDADGHRQQYRFSNQY